jgi:hypothetical protein
MAITASPNTSYNPDSANVTEKYTPLSPNEIGFDPADKATYSWLLTNRYNVLKNLNQIGVPLDLAVPDWTAIRTAEISAGRLPPLVVISSDRSKWIKAGIDAAAAKLAKLGLANFTNVSDLRALTTQDGAPLAQSPPIYCPTRVTANRGVYIVVQAGEYVTYKKALANTGITVVGYEFDRSRAPRDTMLAGFGASRYAALEFCKELRRFAGAAAAGGVMPWNYAWLVDDNVVAVSPFPGLTRLETAMGAGANIAAIGLGGKSKAESFERNRVWADREIAAGRGVQTANLPDPVKPEILQQMVLWNIAYLDANHLNVSPIYVTSAEDTSIQNYFEMKGIAYQWYGGLGIVKEMARADGKSSAKVGAARQNFTKLMADAESAPTPQGAPPPPIQLRVPKPVAGPWPAAEVLGTFVVNRVPNIDGNASRQTKAKCQAGEQITSGAIKKGLEYVTSAALVSTFQINGAAADQVRRRKPQP